MIHDPNLFQAHVVELINERRDYLRAKPSYKKLDPEPYMPPAVLPLPFPRPPKKAPWRRFWGRFHS